jgi:hypothetical protein
VEIQLERAERQENKEGRRGADIHRQVLDMFDEDGGTMYDSFQRVRMQVAVPRPLSENLKELTTSIMLDPSFKEAAADENGTKTWTRKIIFEILESSFSFLPSMEEGEGEGDEPTVPKV